MLHFKCSRSARSARSGPRLWVPHRMATSAVSVRNASHPRPRKAETAMASEVLALLESDGTTFGNKGHWQSEQIVKKLWTILIKFDQLSDFLCQFSEFLFRSFQMTESMGFSAFFRFSSGMLWVRRPALAATRQLWTFNTSWAQVEFVAAGLPQCAKSASQLQENLGKDGTGMYWWQTYLKNMWWPIYLM